MTAKSKRITREACDHAKGCDNKQCVHRKPHAAIHGCWEREQSYCPWIEAMTYCATRRKRDW